MPLDFKDKALKQTDETGSNNNDELLFLTESFIVAIVLF